MAWFGQHNNVDNVEEFESKVVEKTMLRESKTPQAHLYPLCSHISLLEDILCWLLPINGQRF